MRIENERKHKRIMLVGCLGFGPLFNGSSIADIIGIEKSAETKPKSLVKEKKLFDF